MGDFCLGSLSQMYSCVPSSDGVELVAEMQEASEYRRPLPHLTCHIVLQLVCCRFRRPRLRRMNRHPMHRFRRFQECFRQRWVCMNGGSDIFHG